jgi:hypothetical protein
MALAIPRVAPMLFVVAACSGEADTLQRGDGTLLVGTGAGEYTALSEGDAVEAIEGPQGGVHVWVSLRCDRCAEFTPVMLGTRSAETGDWLMGEPQQQTVMFQTIEGTRAAVGLTALLPGSSGQDFVGHQVVLAASVAIDTVDHEDAVRVLVASVGSDDGI